jgi:hypothetical protein
MTVASQDLDLKCKEMNDIGKSAKKIFGGDMRLLQM